MAWTSASTSLKLGIHACGLIRKVPFSYPPSGFLLNGRPVYPRSVWVSLIRTSHSGLRNMRSDTGCVPLHGTASALPA